MSRLVEYENILYANFDWGRNEAFAELELYITTHTTANKTLYAMNLCEGEIFVTEHDEFIYKINEIAKWFKDCYFFNMNPLLQQSFNLLDSKYKSNISKVISYPYSVLNRTKFYMMNENLNSDYKERPFEKHFIFMNAVAKPHRIRMYIDFHKHNILDTAYISWLNRYDTLQPDTIKFHKKVDGVDLSKKKILDRGMLKDTAQDELSSYYENAAIDIFGESVHQNPHCIIVSEKTWKPILYKKVFLGFSIKGFYRWLRNEGFLLYDELIDYSFDDVDDYDKRYELFWNEVYKLSQMPLDELSTKIDGIRWKLDHNYNVAMSKNSIPQMLEPYAKYTDLLWIHK